MEYLTRYELFLRKLVFFNFLRYEEGLEYEDIAYILDTYVEIIQLYDTELLQKMGVEYYESRRGNLYD